MTQFRTGTERRKTVSRYCLHAILILFGFALAPQATSHDGATGIVKERMDMMSALGKTMKTFRAMAYGDNPINMIILLQSAEAISGHSKHMPGLFPTGTFDPPSEALSVIDDHRAEFDGLAERLSERAGLLATLTGPPDQASLKKWYRDTGRLCSACHKRFREKR